MKKIVIIGLSLTLALALVVTVAMAWGPRFGPGFGGGPPFANLTAEQSSQIQALRQALLKEIEPLQRDLVTKKAELRALESIPDGDQTAVMARQKEIWEIVRKLHEKIANATLEAMKLLTPEQRAQFPDFSSGVVGERGFNPIMSKMWGLRG